MKTRIRAALLLAPALTLFDASMIAQQVERNAAPSKPELPCDIYAAGGTPCGAAHSTTRALYGSYNGPLYQVQRASDSSTLDVKPLTPGGVANAAAQSRSLRHSNLRTRQMSRSPARA